MMRSMLARLLSAMLIVTLLAGAAAFAAGDASDPLVSLSYITGVLRPEFEFEIEMHSTGAVAESLAEASNILDSIVARLDERLKALNTPEYGEETLASSVQLKLADNGWYSTSQQNVSVKLEAGERIRFRSGAEFTLSGGSAVIDGSRAAEFSDLSAGSGAYAGIKLVPYKKYALVSNHIAGCEALSSSTFIVCGDYQIIPAYTVSHTDAADVLAGAGLFKGTGNGYSLERTATRLEALIMFLRILGEEDEALAFTGTHPFNDVPYWAGNMADKYVAYSYHMGYFNGVSATRSGASDSVTAEQYMTLVLRALGYSSETDFVWSEALDAAVRFGILTQVETNYFHRRGFYRDGVAYISYRTLFATDRAHGTTLLDKLMMNGSITYEQAVAASKATPRHIQ